MNKKILLICIIALFFDQISKNIASVFLEVGESITIIKNFFNITYINNYGAAWSIFENQNILLIVLSLIALIIIYRYMYLFQKNRKNNIAFGLTLAGITGNLIDRTLFGYVRDFLDFNIFGYDYPVFNIADISVVVGVILLIIAIIKGEDKVGKSSSK